jgi:hypothetical protein
VDKRGDRLKVNGYLEQCGGGSPRRQVNKGANQMGKEHYKIVVIEHPTENPTPEQIQAGKEFYDALFEAHIKRIEKEVSGYLGFGEK